MNQTILSFPYLIASKSDSLFQEKPIISLSLLASLSLTLLGDLFKIICNWVPDANLQISIHNIEEEHISVCYRFRWLYRRHRLTRWFSPNPWNVYEAKDTSKPSCKFFLTQLSQSQLIPSNSAKLSNPSSSTSSNPPTFVQSTSIIATTCLY